MASSQPIHTHNMGQSPFFYYNPESSSENRIHGHFSPHPHAAQESLPMHHYQQQIYYQEPMMHSQQSMVYAQLPSTGPHVYGPQKSILAMTSPRPMQQKPSFLCQYPGAQQLSIDTECNAPDVYIYPSTPPLSTSGSSASSPPSTCDILPTPLTGGYMGLDNIEGVKEGCEGDVQSEILAGGDWTRCCSPPLTPGTFYITSLENDCSSLEMILGTDSTTTFCVGVHWFKHWRVVWLICGVRSIYSPAFANGKPSLRPPFH